MPCFAKFSHQLFGRNLSRYNLEESEFVDFTRPSDLVQNRFAQRPISSQRLCQVARIVWISVLGSGQERDALRPPWTQRLSENSQACDGIRLFPSLDCSWARVFHVQGVLLVSAFVDQPEKDRPKISIRSFLQFTFVCYSFRNVHRVNRELDVSEDLDCPTKVPRVSSWNRSSHRILPSEAKTLQLERCVAERTQLGRNERPFF